MIVEKSEGLRRFTSALGHYEPVTTVDRMTEQRR
jgi:hypothetical protein